jgi:ketosteroid isomerase-like protein
VSERSHHEVVQRYAKALVDHDFDTMDELRHRDYVWEYPQSGERIRGTANVRAIMENYPRRPEITHSAVIGSEDHWVPTPVGTLLRVMGTGDVYTILSRFTYPGDSRPWHLASVIEMRDGKVFKETTIFGAAFDAPEWRAKWVERMSTA